jgi:hypothetical protein
MAREGGLANDMVMWMGKWQRKEEKSGLSRQAFTNEKEPEVLKQDGCTKSQVTIPDPPLSSVSPAQCSEEWSSRSYHMPHISAILGFNQVEMSVAVAMA